MSAAFTGVTDTGAVGIAASELVERMAVTPGEKATAITHTYSCPNRLASVNTKLLAIGACRYSEMSS